MTALNWAVDKRRHATRRAKSERESEAVRRFERQQFQREQAQIARLVNEHKGDHRLYREFADRIADGYSLSRRQVKVARDIAAERKWPIPPAPDPGDRAFAAGCDAADEDGRTLKFLSLYNGHHPTLIAWKNQVASDGPGSVRPDQIRRMRRLLRQEGYDV